VQPSFETTTNRWGRSYNANIFLRPTNSFDLTTNYFLPATVGGDHAFKVGYRWRSAHSTSINHRGGFIEARFTNSVPNSADIYRDQYSESHLDTHAFYVQDTFTRNRLTLNLGFRMDRQDDTAVAAQVPMNPVFPALMPAIDFPSADADVVWNDFSPRLGATYDLTGDGRTILSASSSAGGVERQRNQRHRRAARRSSRRQRAVVKGSRGSGRRLRPRQASPRSRKNIARRETCGRCFAAPTLSVIAATAAGLGSTAPRSRD